MHKRLKTISSINPHIVHDWKREFDRLYHLHGNGPPKGASIPQPLCSEAIAKEDAVTAQSP